VIGNNGYVFRKDLSQELYECKYSDGDVEDLKRLLPGWMLTSDALSTDTVSQRIGR
jgi:hypothetical protein